MIVGNKSDKVTSCPNSIWNAVADSSDRLFVESSAKTAVGVSETFRKVLEKVVNLPELSPTVTTKQTFHDLANILTT
jgi:Ras-related protein Rab-18